VTGPETVGAGLLVSVSMAGMASTMGERGGSRCGLCGVGSSEVVGRGGARSLGVGRGWWCQRE
jgi:hypothetical protein